MNDDKKGDQHLVTTIRYHNRLMTVAEYIQLLIIQGARPTVILIRNNKAKNSILTFQQRKNGATATEPDDQYSLHYAMHRENSTEWHRISKKAWLFAHKCLQTPAILPEPDLIKRFGCWK
jgi:hypothetical protein